jgi:hypothetical protein
MGTGPLNPEDLTEEQLRAAYEQEIKRVRVEHVLLENIVTVINLGMRRTGLMPGTEDERDLAQVQLAVESVRAQIPQIQQIAPDQADPIIQAVSQLQLAFVQASGAGGGAPSAPRPEDGAPAPGAAPASGPAPAPAAATGPAPAPAPAAEPPAPEPGQPGPAQQSGRLWIPGQ